MKTINDSFLKSILTVVILSLFSCEAIAKKTHHKLEDITFLDEKDRNFVASIRSHKIRASFLYNFYTADLQNKNKESKTYLASDFSPGFLISYQTFLSSRTSFNLKTSYQRVIFEKPMVNELVENGISIVDASATLGYGFNDLFEGEVGFGYGTDFYIDSVKSGLAKIITLSRPRVIALMKMNWRKNRYFKNINLSLGINNFIKKENLQNNIAPFIGLGFDKKKSTFDLGMSVRYSQANQSIGELTQVNKKIFFQFDLLFQGMK